MTEQQQQALYDHYNRVNNGLRGLSERVANKPVIHEKLQAVMLAYIELDKIIRREEVLERIERAKASIAKDEQELRILDGIEEEEPELL